MNRTRVMDPVQRYQAVSAEKATGSTYTPEVLAEFVARQILKCANVDETKPLTILDPAVGDGQLVVSLLKELSLRPNAGIEVHGFDTSSNALDTALERIQAAFPNVSIVLHKRDFLGFAAEQKTGSLFSEVKQERFDLIIANPPYVRTQIMGAQEAQRLSQTFGLSGRVDLYQAFLLAMADVLKPDGVAGMIVSNRFMTIKGGSALRIELSRRFDLRHVWDLGDTKIFEAAVLPAVIVAAGRKKVEVQRGAPLFSCIYETQGTAERNVPNPIEALQHSGIVEIAGGRKFQVRHGVLDNTGGQDAVWRIATKQGDEWLERVTQHTWKQFGGIGKVRVGVKTCADSIFIRRDWEKAPGAQKIELLRPLTTHHSAARFRAVAPKHERQILYPHELVDGRRQAIALEKYPYSKAYLEAHRAKLEGRRYVIEAGRQWYEIWVPQDPAAWSAPKLVFRDISERPTFWIDLDGTVVNGDCYWLVPNRAADFDLLWLALAVANSTFIEAFYDHCFNNKLYSGRRRFITQYVEKFPLPDPEHVLSKEIIRRAKAIYDANHSDLTANLEGELDMLVWDVFGLRKEVFG
ncbi:Eco57I restriction-modification methylase domain-containing protein [Reyranella sp.]|uniref:Eco57I restriction-modification methylase domain-containing protein n=1 Tax=Reyranella sp. TaxID=1929291 RepID=UPI003BAD39C0